MKSLTFSIINLVFVVVVLSGLLTGCRYIEPKQWISKDIDTLIEYSKGLENIIRQDSLRYHQEIDRIRTETRLKEDSLRTLFETNTTLAERKFVVVAGAFRVPANAHNYAKQMISQGYSGEIITRQDSFRLVCTGAYPNLRQAITALGTIRERVSAEAWIFVRE